MDNRNRNKTFRTLTAEPYFPRRTYHRICMNKFNRPRRHTGLLRRRILSKGNLSCLDRPSHRNRRTHHHHLSIHNHHRVLRLLQCYNTSPLWPHPLHRLLVRRSNTRTEDALKDRKNPRLMSCRLRIRMLGLVSGSCSHSLLSLWFFPPLRKDDYLSLMPLVLYGPFDCAVIVACKMRMRYCLLAMMTDELLATLKLCEGFGLQGGCVKSFT
jgi:hypothetical protein